MGFGAGHRSAVAGHQVELFHLRLKQRASRKSAGPVVIFPREMVPQGLCALRLFPDGPNVQKWRSFPGHRTLCIDQDFGRELHRTNDFAGIPC